MAIANQPFTLEVLVHLEPVAREGWQGNDDERPLNELGKRQAERLAEGLGRVDAVFSSPGLRIRQSVEPLARRLGLPILELPEFQVVRANSAPAGWGRPDSPDPLGGAISAGSTYMALRRVLGKLPSAGRGVICSGGDIIPLFLAFLSGAYGAEMPPRVNRRGSVYTVVVSDERATLKSREPAADFPA